MKFVVCEICESVSLEVGAKEVFTAPSQKQHPRCAADTSSESIQWPEVVIIDSCHHIKPNWNQ